MKKVHDNERNDTSEDFCHGYVGHSLNDEEVKAYGWSDETHFRDSDDQNSEPDGVDAEFMNGS